MLQIYKYPSLQCSDEQRVFELYPEGQKKPQQKKKQQKPIKVKCNIQSRYQQFPSGNCAAYSLASKNLDYSNFLQHRLCLSS